MKNITLSKPEIQTYFGRYTEFSRKAANSKDSEVDLKAAFYAPVLLLQGPRTFYRFEETMDKVLFHLDCAYGKAIDQDTKTRVALSAQILLEFHITLIELKLREEKQSQVWDIFRTLLTSAKSIIANIGRNDEAGLIDDVSKLFSACVSFFISTRMTKDDEKGFYEQLLKVYKKVLNSPVYSKQYNLVKNSFIRVDSKRLLLMSLHSDKFASTVDLLQKFGFRSDEIGGFLRQVFDELQTNTKNKINVAPEDIISTRINIKNNKLPNQHELDEIILDLFKTKILPRSLSKQGLSKSLLYIKEFGSTDQEVKILLISVIENITPQTEMSDFIDIMVFSKENNLPLVTIKEKLLKAYEQKFSSATFSAIKYIPGFIFLAPVLCIGSIILLWKSEPALNGGWSVITGFFSSLLHASIGSIPYVLGILLLAFGAIVLVGSVINSSALREHKKKVTELDHLLSAKITSV